MLGTLFDPKAETHIYEHCRPHWSQAGAVVFLTFRLADSIPREVLERWDRQKQEWLQVRGYGDRMGDFVVMPNHVHLLTAFASESIMKSQCDSWLHYTAFRINPLIGSKGKLWQQEPFDHLVRSIDQYDYLRDYIQKNPLNAKLKPGEYLYRRFDG